MQKKIRTHTKAKVPFQLIAGGDDRDAGAVSFRFRDGRQDNGVPSTRRSTASSPRSATARRSDGQESSRSWNAAQPGGTPDIPGTVSRRRRGVDPDPLVIRDAATGAAVPDAFQRLWNPHRMAYIDAGRDGKAEVTRRLPVLRGPAEVRRGRPDRRPRRAYVLLNLFPYNNGHLLVCPYRHVPLYDEATAEETREMAS